jgi:glutathione S-transferase
MINNLFGVVQETSGAAIKLYHDPTSTTSRGVLLFLAEHDLTVEKIVVSLMESEHRRAEYAAINPNQAVPALVDDDLVIGEGSAILKYLADLAGSPTYPLDLKQRARINAMMDWFNTGLSRDLNYSYCYPQMLANNRFDNPTVQAGVLRRGLENGKRWLTILNDHFLAHDQAFLLGREISLADYLGASYLSVCEAVELDLSPWPRVEAWMERMRSRPSWLEVFPAFYGLVAAIREIRRAEVWTPLGRATFTAAPRPATRCA